MSDAPAVSVSLDEQIKCVVREIALRRAVYPGFVAKGKLRQEVAEREQAAMMAVLDTLKKLKAVQDPESWQKPSV